MKRTRQTTPQTPQAPQPMTKEQFLIEWVLARASFRGDGFDGVLAAESAEKVWDKIQAIK